MKMIKSQWLRSVTLLCAWGVQNTLSGNDEIPAEIARSETLVEVMTCPLKADTRECFSRRYVFVRINGNRVQISDIDLYANRKPSARDSRIEFRSDHKVGYLDTDGRIVIPARFESGEAFKEKVAVVELDGKFGYIRQDGTWLREPSLDWAHDFQNGYASACDGRKWGFLNTAGDWHLEPQFERLDPVEGGWYAAKPNGEKGFFDPVTLKFIEEGAPSADRKREKAEPSDAAESR